MNKNKALDKLTELIEGIIFHSLFLSELLNLVAGKGFEEKVFKLLTKQLILLNRYGVMVTNTKEFENIGRGLYSMHLTGSGFNLRILFAFLPNAQPVLLLAFHERAGKSKTDYSSYLDPALARFAEKKEEYELGYI